MEKSQVQRRIKDQILANQFRGIVLSSVRSGKTRILLEALQEDWGVERLHKPKVLVCYPNIDIKSSWETECALIGYFPDIGYCTFASLHKIEDSDTWDYIIIDEAHLLGEENQLPSSCKLVKNNAKIIFASGTYNKNTLEELQIHSGLDLIVNYSTDDAIKDGIVSDFTIFIHKYALDISTVREYGQKKKWFSTESKECARLTYKVDLSSGKERMFHSLARMRFINTSYSLTSKVKNFLVKNPNKRFLLFVADEKTGKRYGIPMFNSKSKDCSNLENFQNGKINGLCLIKKGSAGVTYPNLQDIIITNINSNGENLEQQIGRSLLTDTDKSNIHIFISNQRFQLKWLEKALENIDKTRIIWV